MNRPSAPTIQHHVHKIIWMAKENFVQVKDKQEKEEKEWAEKLERERARTLNKVGEKHPM